MDFIAIFYTIVVKIIFETFNFLYSLEELSSFMMVCEMYFNMQLL